MNDIELKAEIAQLQASLAQSDKENEILRESTASLRAKFPWHRDGKGPDVPVLQERYDALREHAAKLEEQLEELGPGPFVPKHQYDDLKSEVDRQKEHNKLQVYQVQEASRRRKKAEAAFELMQAEVGSLKVQLADAIETCRFQRDAHRTLENETQDLKVWKQSAEKVLADWQNVLQSDPSAQVGDSGPDRYRSLITANEELKEALEEAQNKLEIVLRAVQWQLSGAGLPPDDKDDYSFGIASRVQSLVADRDRSKAHAQKMEESAKAHGSCERDALRRMELALQERDDLRASIIKHRYESKWMRKQDAVLWDSLKLSHKELIEDPDTEEEIELKDQIIKLEEQLKALKEDLWVPCDQTLQCALCGWIDWEISGQSEKHPVGCPLGHIDNSLSDVNEELFRLKKAVTNLRDAQRAYMADRGNEALGKAVADAAKEVDQLLGPELKATWSRDPSSVRTNQDELKEDLYRKVGPGSFVLVGSRLDSLEARARTLTEGVKVDPNEELPEDPEEEYRLHCAGCGIVCGIQASPISAFFCTRCSEPMPPKLSLHEAMDQMPSTVLVDAGPLEPLCRGCATEIEPVVHTCDKPKKCYALVDAGPVDNSYSAPCWQDEPCPDHSPQPRCKTCGDDPNGIYHPHEGPGITGQMGGDWWGPCPDCTKVEAAQDFIGPCVHGRDPYTRCDECGRLSPGEAERLAKAEVKCTKFIAGDKRGFCLCGFSYTYHHPAEVARRDRKAIQGGKK